MNVSSQLQSHRRNEAALPTGDWASFTPGLKLLLLVGIEALSPLLQPVTLSDFVMKIINEVN
jgi:hypothetical protein